MSNQLTTTDKQLICTVNEQVGLLLQKSASDSTIVNTMIDFIPDVKCLLNNDNDKLLELHYMEHKNFAYFAKLIEAL